MKSQLTPLLTLILFPLLAKTATADSALGNALGQPDWTWNTGGDSPWVVSNNGGPYDSAVQSGTLNANEESWLETEIEGPGFLSFAWKTSTRWNHHFLTFSIDGKTHLRASGETDWEIRTVELAPGNHLLRWSFAKDTLPGIGDDSTWLANIVWEPTRPFIFLEPSSQKLPADGGIYEIQISTDQNWTVESSPDWLVVSKESGSGNGLLTIEVSPNLGIAPRSGIISIGNSEHFISQAATTDPHFAAELIPIDSDEQLLRFPAEPGIRYRAEFSTDLREWRETEFQLHDTVQTSVKVPDFLEVEIGIEPPADAKSDSRHFWRIRAQTPPPNYSVVPAGPFLMGDSHAEEKLFMMEASPAHLVSTDSFYISPNPVSFAEWQEIVTWAVNNGYDFDHPGQRGADADWNELPESPENNRHPVVAISWYDAVKWCNAKSEFSGAIPAYYTDVAQTTIYRTGQIDLTDQHVRWNAPGYRLPREAEWEKAARAGWVRKRWPWGNEPITAEDANYTPAGETESGTSAPGSFPSNAYGLEEMVGNIWEWTWDWHAKETYRKRADSRSKSPIGPPHGYQRIVRGGSWDSTTEFTPLSTRLGMNPGTTLPVQGFRPVFGNGLE
ncbi:MAG TPA: SUMF1/EgtB/PvdO family nonheme iron enzyme [Opitutales bacterium]|nr:SUMF1/EgtB/PvdO family nonheme iron enzyme [Opitutales bacterium]